MNDHDLEDALRTTFAGRAGTVTRGPGWDGADEFVATPAHRRRARWVAPLAAAAAVFALVGVVLGLRDSSRTNGWTSPAAQRPVPAGMKAVDALGVEIFVPSKWMVDAGPCPFDGVRRPIAEPESWRGAKCAPSLDDTSTSVTIAPGGGQLFPGLGGACTSTTVRLGGTNDVGCVYRAWQTQPGQFSYVVAWAQHHVNLSVVSTNRGLALRILQSAHAVPVDRNGCAARSDANALAGPAQRTDPSVLFDSELLPASTQQLSVCWYIANRLAASALLDHPASQRVLTVAKEMAPRWPAPSGQASLPSCAAVARTDGVVLIAHQSGQPDRTAVADFAACDGLRTTRSATAAFMSDSRLATAIRSATGIPLTLNYRSTN